jgi:hypothetical protein
MPVIAVCGYGSGIYHLSKSTQTRSSRQRPCCPRSPGSRFRRQLNDSAAETAVFATIREKLGPITIVLWNTHSMAAGDLLTASRADLIEVLGNDFALGECMVASQSV